MSEAYRDEEVGLRARRDELLARWQARAAAVPAAAAAVVVRRAGRLAAGAVIAATVLLVVGLARIDGAGALVRGLCAVCVPGALVAFVGARRWARRAAGRALTPEAGGALRAEVDWLDGHAPGRRLRALADRLDRPALVGVLAGWAVWPWPLSAAGLALVGGLDPSMAEELTATVAWGLVPYLASGVAIALLVAWQRPRPAPAAPQVTPPPEVGGLIVRHINVVGVGGALVAFIAALADAVGSSAGEAVGWTVAWAAPFVAALLVVRGDRADDERVLALLRDEPPAL